jgi:hypothetical protein
MKKSDLFKGKPAPILPKIKGIPLPKDEGEFFEETEENEELEIPDYSKLRPQDLQNREEDPKFRTTESDSLEQQKVIPKKKEQTEKKKDN